MTTMTLALIPATLPGLSSTWRPLPRRVNGISIDVDISSDAIVSGEGDVADPALRIRFRDTALLCEMFTGRLNLPLALIRGRLRLRGKLRLFLRFGSLFSVDARN